LTNARGEPHVGGQLLSEIDSADSIEVVMAFIRLSGIRNMLDTLRRHCSAGKHLRILTTTYTGTTDARALDALEQCGADIRVSYDTTTTRLHAKAWLFTRLSGYSTAYIGSSNLTHSAQVAGLEWNTRISGARNTSVIERVAATFETYWNTPDFEPYVAADFQQRRERNSSDADSILSPIEVRLYPFQERLLEQLALSRQQGAQRNLLVSATGTGKTVMAAVDYSRLAKTLPRARLLFVAHRKEILQQSLLTFRHALRDGAFGESWVGGQRPTRFDHVFASIQSLNANDLTHLAEDHFDVVIIDEFHHAAAVSYRRLVEHVKPAQLLGLTATPERSDGVSILDWFGGKIAAELRLWDAIDQQRLTPFAYYGIADGNDLRDVPWRRGSGYDIEGLTGVLTADDAKARLVVKELKDKVDSIEAVRAIGFCVSVAHARFMARVFNEVNVAAIAIWADTPSAERAAALKALAAGDIKVLFSVDLFNEGVDIPSVNTLLMLRPTESGTLFLQQLGRGLRRHRDKSLCTVLDFVGQHRAEFRYDKRFKALLGGTRLQVRKQVEAGFPYLPAGCQMQLDAVASKSVLQSLKNALPSTKAAKVAELRVLGRSGSVSLSRFIKESGLALEDVYTSSHGWSDLLEAAGLTTADSGPDEKKLRKACSRLLHIDDFERIDYYRDLLNSPDSLDIDSLEPRSYRLLRMLVGSVAGQVLQKGTTVAEGWQTLKNHPQVCRELIELLKVLAGQISHLHHPLYKHPQVPLQVHARYTRIEILAAMGIGQTARATEWREGVRWVEAVPADLLAFTLNKSEGRFSPTTRYRDYAISRELIHWESQSMTRASSPAGQRYQHHDRYGSAILLFARESAADRDFTFLGTARYVSHESEQPMAITWKLDHKLPGDLYAAYAAAVA
jgi:superfamily II DNA or RNA helicase/HKD family nuclease